MKRSTTPILILIMAFAATLAACAEVDPATPEGPNVDLPCGITTWFYVAAGSSDSNADGSEKNPYGTLQAALEAIEPGGALIISPGDYTGALHISKNVHIMGTASVDDSVFLRQDSAQNLITVDSGATVTFQDLTITGGQDAILWATGEGTSVTINDATLACPATPEAGSAGQGIVVEEGASLIFDAGSLTGCAAHGVLVHDGTLVMDMVTISNHGQGGVRLEGARAGSELRSVIIEDNQGFGVGLLCGELAMVQSVIQYTSSPGGGDGVLASTLTGLDPSDPLFGCTTSLTLGGVDLAMGNTIRANHRAGVLIEGNVDALIRENDVQLNGNGGIWAIGASAPDETEVQILANRVIENLHVGVGVVDAARASVAGNTVLRTTPVEGWSQQTTFGDGVYVFEAASEVYGNTVEMNTRYGVLLSSPTEGSCLGDDNSFDGNMQPWKWQEAMTLAINVHPCTMIWQPVESAGKDLEPLPCEEEDEECDNEAVLPSKNEQPLHCNSPSCVAEPSNPSCLAECSQDLALGIDSYVYANEEDCGGCYDGNDATICPNDEATEKGLLLPCCQSPTHDYLYGSGE